MTREWRTRTRWCWPVAVGAALAAFPAASAEHPAAPDEAALRATAVAVFPELLELLALPNDSHVPADIQRNAAWLEGALARRGFRTRQLENGGVPLVFAEHAGNRDGRRTILFYFHFDGQPVVASQWAQADPWHPVVKRQGTGRTWSEVDTAQLLRPDFDPELRLFGRSASDDKGPILMFLAALDVLAARHQEAAFNVKVLLDSQEELGSPGMAAVVAASGALLAADALVICDGPTHASGRPTLAFGNRGAVDATLTVFGPRSPLHSGHFGNYVPNPAQRLATLLASLKDDDGRVRVAGYYARTRLSAQDRRALAGVPDDEGALRARVGIAAAEQVGATYQEALQYPSLNIRGLAAASVGDQVANVIPQQAVAELDLRTTPEADAAYLLGLLERHVRAQGYHLVEGEPTDEDRTRYPKLARLRVGHAELATRAPLDSPVGRWAAAALEATFAPAKPVRIRMMGGTVPTAALVTPLHLPFVLVPLVNADNNQHAFDENLRMGNFLSGMKTLAALLQSPYGGD